MRSTQAAVKEATAARTFNMDSFIAAVELKQMVTDYCAELDLNNGMNVTDFFTEDAVVKTGAIDYAGHAAMKKFYAERAEKIHALKDGTRTARHGYTNFKVTFPEKDLATVTFLVVYFSGEGKPPLLNATTPSIVADSKFECRRSADGQWRIFRFTGQPVFVGADPFVNKAVVGR
jgi:hypothetical protein